MNKIKKCLKNIYRKLFPMYIDHLGKELEGKTVLDIGCGNNSPFKYFSENFYSVGVDLFKPYLKESKRGKIHNEYILSDVKKVEFKEKSFDIVLCLDVLEHLTKEDGYELIKKMENWGKKIIIFTPNGFLEQNEYDENKLQVHLSGWTVKAFKDLGYDVRGINGLKFLLGEEAKPKFKPHILNYILSNLTSKFTYYLPKLAFSLLCIKEVK